MIVSELTLVTASFNTPEVTLAMLKSFAHHHQRYWPIPLLLMENSTDNITAELLQRHSVPFHRTPGLIHSIAIDRALPRVRTRYALLVDTDVIFRRNIDGLLDRLRGSGAAILGEFQGDRGGFLMHARIAPYFCLIDACAVQEKGIRFHDDQRIERTNSRGFYVMRPTPPSSHQRYYDVGATFLEDIFAARLAAEAVPVQELHTYVHHAAALSWGPTADEVTKAHVRRSTPVFWNVAADYAGTDIRGAYVDYTRAGAPV